MPECEVFEFVPFCALCGVQPEYSGLPEVEQGFECEVIWF